MRLSQAVFKYLAARHHELAITTRANYRSELVRAADAIGPDMLVRMVKRKHVEGWLAGQTCSPRTIRMRLSTFRQFTAWCVESGLMKHDPCRGLKAPAPSKLMPREVSEDEYARLLAVLPDARARVIVTLGFVQGLRRASIAGQLREDLDLDGRMMLVSSVKGGGQLWLPLDPEAVDAIHAYLAELPCSSGPLIRSVKEPGRPVTPRYVGQLVSMWMQEAGVKQYAYDGKSSHALRHGFAGSLLDSGVDVRVVQHLMGHESLSSTFIYTRRRHAAGPLKDALEQRRLFREAS